MMEFLAQIFSRMIFAKGSIIVVWQGVKYAFGKVSLQS